MISEHVSCQNYIVSSDTAATKHRIFFITNLSFSLCLGEAEIDIAVDRNPHVHSPNAFNSQGWARRTAGVLDSVLVSDVGARDVVR